MSGVTTFLRRAFLLTAITGAAGAAWSWWRNRGSGSESAPAEWPPFDAQTAASAATVSTPPSAPPPGAATVTETPAGAGAGQPSGNGDATWVEPESDGSCPITHPIKANDNSGIFHVPGGRFYDRTLAERCYSSAEAATADGYRQAKT